MKGIHFALLTLLGYAIFNVMAEKNVAKKSALEVNAYCAIGYAFFAVIALILVKTFGQHEPGLPENDMWLVIGVFGFLLFAAEYCYFSAYSEGIKLIVMTTILMCSPVLCSIMKFMIDGTRPRVLELVAWGLGAIAVVLVAIAQQSEPRPPPP